MTEKCGLNAASRQQMTPKQFALASNAVQLTLTTGHPTPGSCSTITGFICSGTQVPKNRPWSCVLICPSFLRNAPSWWQVALVSLPATHGPVPGSTYSSLLFPSPSGALWLLEQASG